MRMKMMTLILILILEARMRIMVLSNLQRRQELVMSSPFLWASVFMFYSLSYVITSLVPESFFHRICIWFKKAIAWQTFKGLCSYLFLWCVKLDQSPVSVIILGTHITTHLLLLTFYNRAPLFLLQIIGGKSRWGFLPGILSSSLCAPTWVKSERSLVLNRSSEPLSITYMLMSDLLSGKFDLTRWICQIITRGWP